MFRIENREIRFNATMEELVSFIDGLEDSTVTLVKEGKEETEKFLDMLYEAYFDTQEFIRLNEYKTEAHTHYGYIKYMDEVRKAKKELEVINKMCEMLE